MENRQILASKLKPPKLRYVLDRPRLLRLVSPASTFKYVSLCAGPGYGKTTLMAQIARFYPGSHVWYQVDNLDKDPAVLLKHIISGVAQLCEEIGPRSMARLAECSDAAVDGNSVLAVLADEISEHLKTPLAVCFDDFHLFEGTDFALDFMTTLINELPNDCTVFIASRAKPRLKLGKMRTKGAVLELRQKELQFSLEELRELLSQTWNIDLDDSTLDKLHKNTEGWAAGLVLMEDYLRSGIAVPEIMSGTKVKRNVYEYLAEEVLSRQSERLRNLLEMCSLIDPVDPHICQEALGIQDAPALLDMAEKMNLFTTRVGETHLYRFHPLFREILHSRLNERIGIKNILELQNSFGAAYENAGEIEEAISQYLKSKHCDKAIQLIEDVGSDMLKNGEHITLSRWLEDLEDPLSLPLEMYQGQIKLLEAKPGESLTLLQLVKQRLKQDDKKLLCETSVAIAESYCMFNMPLEAIKEIEPLLDLDLPNEQRFDLLYRMSVYCWSTYDDERVLMYIDQARRLVHEELTPQLLFKANAMLAGMCLRSGEFPQAKQYLMQIIQAKGLDSSHKNRYLNNLASCLTMLGKYQESKEIVEECLEIVHKQKETKRFITIYDTYGCCLLALGFSKEGKKYLRDSIDLNNELNTSSYESCLAKCHLGTDARRNGEYTFAMEYHSESLQIATSFDEYYDMAINISNVGADLLRVNQVEEAEKYFVEAERLSVERNFKYALTHIDFHRAWLNNTIGKKESEIEYLRRALKRANKYQQNHFIIQEGKISLPLFVTALENDIEPGYVCWILEKIGTKSLTAIEPLINSDRIAIRARCARLLQAINDPRAITLARKLSRDSDREVRQLAVNALEKLRNQIVAPDEILTPRESQVLDLIGSGASNAAIAKQLYVSERTVKTHVTNIFRKLGLTNRIEAVLYYQRMLEKKYDFSD